MVRAWCLVLSVAPCAVWCCRAALSFCRVLCGAVLPCSVLRVMLWCLALLCSWLLRAVRWLLGRLFVCCAALLVAAACCALSLVVPSGWVFRGVVCPVLVCLAVCCAVLCAPGCRAAPRCCALCRPVLCCCVLCCFFCARLVPLLVVPCPLALPVALGPCAVRRCVLQCSPALYALCGVCFVVACWCVLLFAAVLCAVCVLGCCTVRSLSSSLCAVLCCAVLVRLRCAVRVVRADAGAWRCGALLCVVLFPLVFCGAVLGLVARRCLLVACIGVGVPAWQRGLLPCGWCGLLSCPVSLCRVLWCCAVAWCFAVVLCCCFAVLFVLALPSCALSCGAVLCCAMLLVICAFFCPVVASVCCGALSLPVGTHKKH